MSPQQEGREKEKRKTPSTERGDAHPPTKGDTPLPAGTIFKNKNFILIALIAIVLLSYAWSFQQYRHGLEAEPAEFVSPFLLPGSTGEPNATTGRWQPQGVSLQEKEQPFKSDEFITASGTIQVHVASIAELSDGLAAVWYGGIYEGSRDTLIYFTTQKAGGTWTTPVGIVSRDSATRELNRYIKKVGNPLLYSDSDERLWLFFVTVSVGGWSGSALNVKTSGDGGKTWTESRRLTLSPFFNVSTLVRNNPLALSDGGIAVPIYHECLGTFSEMLWLPPGFYKEGNRGYSKTRMTWGRRFIQPSVVAQGPRRAAVFYRSLRDNSMVTKALSCDGGVTWSSPAAIDLPNPGAGLNALLLTDNRVLLVYNDSKTDRHNLALAVSRDNPAGTPGKPDKEEAWQRVTLLENAPGEEFSYPYMLRTGDGKIHLVYTWKRKRIKHVVFNEAWLNSSRQAGVK
ncbi:MAG: exo-alpha-sialidase [bacterium]|nr:exo-alpha-sialidase [bacterium]